MNSDRTHLIESSARALSKSSLSSFFLPFVLAFFERGVSCEAACSVVGWPSLSCAVAFAFFFLFFVYTYET